MNSMKKYRHALLVGPHVLLEFCAECAQPIVKFLDKKKLLQDKLECYGFKKEAEPVS